MNRMKPTATLELVTPNMARTWLEQNHGNRSVRRRKVGTYAADMRAGDWPITGDAVRFDWDNVLIDGQHRLMGVVEADVAVEMFVVRGLDPAVRIVIDTGAKRSPGDALKFAGVPHYSTDVAAMAKTVILWNEGSLKKSGSSSSGREVTNSELIEWAGANAERAVEFITLTGRIVNKGNGFPTPSKSALAAALFVLADVDNVQTQELASDMANLRMAGRGDPLHALFTRLNMAKTRREVLRPAGLLFCYFRTWNARVDGEPLMQLKIGTAGATGAITIPTPKRPARALAVSA